MFDFSTLWQKASEFLGGTGVADLAQTADAGQLLEKVGLDQAELANLSDLDAAALLSNVGFEADGMAEGLGVDELLSKLRDG
jgi:hypothetical protein